MRWAPCLRDPGLPVTGESVVVFSHRAPVCHPERVERQRDDEGSTRSDLPENGRKKINRFGLIALLPSLRSVGRNDKKAGHADTDFNITGNWCYASSRPNRLRKKRFSAACSLTLVSPRGREVKESSHLLSKVRNFRACIGPQNSFFRNLLRR